MIKKTLATLFILIFAQSLWANNQQTQGPVTIISRVSKQMLVELKKNKSKLDDPKVIDNIVHRIVLPHVDLDDMVVTTLGREGYQSWKTASPAEKSAFKKAFTQLVINTYGSALKSFNNEQVKVYPVRGGVGDRTRVTVFSRVFRDDGPPVGLTYRLELKSGQWKVYDFSVEGISLVQSYQSQFQSILQNEGFKQLLATLEKHNASANQ